MATQITAFTAIPDKADNTKSEFASNVTTFTSELVTFKSSVDTIVGEMNADRTKVVTTNAGLILDDLATVIAAGYSPAVTIAPLGIPPYIAINNELTLTVQSGKNLSVGQRVVVLPFKTADAIAAYGDTLNRIFIKGIISSYSGGSLSIAVEDYVFDDGYIHDVWMVIPSAPSKSLLLSAASYTTMTPELGSKTFVATTYRDLTVGMSVHIRSSGLFSSEFMDGIITAYTPSTGSMTVYVTNISSSTTERNDWVISVSSPDRSTKSIGISQSWQDMTASRSLDVVYTNTTTSPIEVAVTYHYTGTSTINSDIIIGLNDLSISLMYPNWVRGAEYFTVTAIVPPGWMYYAYATTANPPATLSSWSELRSLDSLVGVTDTDGNYVKDIDDNFITDIDL